MLEEKQIIHLLLGFYVFLVGPRIPLKVSYSRIKNNNKNKCKYNKNERIFLKSIKHHEALK